MPPALIVLADAPSQGVPDVTDEPALADALLQRTLDLARRVVGVGRVLFFHPPEEEPELLSRAFGFRLWPQQGGTRGQRYANAFRQAIDLGYEGALTIGTNVPGFPADVLTEGARMLENHQGVVSSDGHGGIAALGLQCPEPTLFPPTLAQPPGYDELLTRATQQRVRITELEPYEALTAETVRSYLEVPD